MFNEYFKIDDNFIFFDITLSPGNSNSPIVIRVAFFKDNEKVLEARRNLKGTNIFIGEDLTKPVTDIGKRLFSWLKKAKEWLFDYRLKKRRRESE